MHSELKDAVFLRAMIDVRDPVQASDIAGQLREIMAAYGEAKIRVTEPYWKKEEWTVVLIDLYAQRSVLDVFEQVKDDLGTGWDIRNTGWDTEALWISDRQHWFVISAVRWALLGLCSAEARRLGERARDDALGSK